MANVLDTTLCDTIVSDLRQICGFFSGTQVSSTNKTPHNWNIVESGVKHHTTFNLNVSLYTRVYMKYK